MNNTNVDRADMKHTEKAQLKDTQLVRNRLNVIQFPHARLPGG